MQIPNASDEFMTGRQKIHISECHWATMRDRFRLGTLTMDESLQIFVKATSAVFLTREVQ